MLRIRRTLSEIGELVSLAIEILLLLAHHAEIPVIYHTDCHRYIRAYRGRKLRHIHLEAAVTCDTYYRSVRIRCLCSNCCRISEAHCSQAS